MKNLKYLLRIAIFLTFLGHGISAIKGNNLWLAYLEVVGFSLEKSKELILIIGIFDVIIAFIILLKPYKYVVLWSVIWAFSTALIRPISGEPIWEFIERGSNWITPLILYISITKSSNSDI
jgi:hypothetical protein